MIKKLIIIFCLNIISSFVFAQNEQELGQTIQINARLHSFVGKPSWLLIIRDVDNNRTIPYLFDFKRGTNFWLAFTYSRNYLITVSNLQFSPYSRDPYKIKKIKDFCHLESHGRIIRGKSMSVTIKGHLSPNQDTFSCHISKYTDGNFTITPANPDEETD